MKRQKCSDAQIRAKIVAQAKIEAEGIVPDDVPASAAPDYAWSSRWTAFDAAMVVLGDECRLSDVSKWEEPFMDAYGKAVEKLAPRRRRRSR